ncbi:MAG: AAA family ATPase, partial [Pontixanthobacter sp.]
MLIKRLKLSGFKSFVEPAELRIEPGLTGVVGPNGCGKSNLLEAIRWVMGENSPKSMRSGGMEDVIFAGTETRPPRDFAEVVLQAEDAHGEELEVTRRIERGAGSAYRVNGSDVRAKDVSLTFADAATGAHSPALVSQGKIAQVIAAKPTERRQMLEEAAGIAGLHVRRRDAESKLRSTEKNLERLEDLMAGLDTQIASLRRQAKQAERYTILTQQITTAEARLLFARWRDAASAAEAAREQAQTAERAVVQAKVGSDEAQQAQHNAASGLAKAREEQSDRRDDASAHGHRMASLTSQLEAAEQRLADLERQKVRLEQDRGDADRLTKDAAEALARLEKDLAANEKSLANDETRRPMLAAALDEAERAGRAAELALAKATADQAGVEAEWRIAESEVAQVQSRIDRLTAEAARQAHIRASLAEGGDPDAAITEARRGADTAATTLARLRSELELAQQRKQELQIARDSAGDALASANAELAGVEREFNALTRDRDARDKQRAQRKGLPTALDEIRAKPGYERALAAVLGRDAKTPLGSPDGDNDGRFWAGSDAPAEVSGSLAQHVTACPPQLKARLALVHFADADDSRVLKPGEWLVTAKGHLRRWDGFIARGEGAAEAARLEADNRLSELETQLPPMRAAAQAAQESQSRAQEDLTALQRQLVAQERGVGEA